MLKIIYMAYDLNYSNYLKCLRYRNSEIEQLLVLETFLDILLIKQLKN